MYLWVGVYTRCVSILSIVLLRFYLVINSWRAVFVVVVWLWLSVYSWRALRLVATVISFGSSSFFGLFCFLPVAWVPCESRQKKPRPSLVGALGIAEARMGTKPLSNRWLL